MFKVEQICIRCESSSTIERQGNRLSTYLYLRQGYFIKVSWNGYWVLVQPAQVIVTAYCGENGSFTYDMKDDILEKYGRSKISYGLVETFKNDFSNGSLSVEADESNLKII